MPYDRSRVLPHVETPIFQHLLIVGTQSYLVLEEVVNCFNKIGSRPSSYLTSARSISELSQFHVSEAGLEVDASSFHDLDKGVEQNSGAIKVSSSVYLRVQIQVEA